jgi:hypothetical protein
MAENQVHMIKQLRLCLLKFLTLLLQLPGSPVKGAGWWHVEGSVQLMALLFCGLRCSDPQLHADAFLWEDHRWSVS